MYARANILVVLCLAVLSGCGDVVDHYATLQDAIDDSLFERGWLPDILPESANRITISNDLDNNDSQGDFYFNPSDLPEFVAHLQPYSKPESGFVNFSSLVDKMQSAGYKIYQYSKEGYTWVFFCHSEKGHCEYVMW